MVQSSLADVSSNHAVLPEPSSLVELIPSAALVYTGEGRILAANRMFGDLLGRVPAELARLQLGDLCAMQERRHDTRPMPTCSRDGVPN